MINMRRDRKYLYSKSCFATVLLMLSCCGRVSADEFQNGRFRPLIANRITQTFTAGTDAPEVVNNSIAGNIDGWARKNQPVPVTLTGVNVPPPGIGKPQTVQLNNSNPMLPFKYRTSSEIGDSIAAVCIGFGEIIADYTRNSKSYPWGAYYLIDGEKLQGKQNTCFSSKMYRQAEPKPSPWVIIRMKECRMINTVIIQCRNTNKTSFGNFPLDFTILVSRDEKEWQTVVTKRDFIPNLQNKGKQQFSFPPIEAKYLKIMASKLRPEKNNVHYFQLREVEIRCNNSQNYALASNGSYAYSSGSVKNDNFDYEYFYDSIFDAGVKRVLISYPVDYKKVLNGKIQKLPDSLISNLKYLIANKIRISLRLKRTGLAKSLSDEPEKTIREWAKFNQWAAVQLKDYIDNWVIGNEVNFSPRFRYDFITLVKQTATAVRSTGYNGLFSVNTALFDFGWTEQALKAGLDKVIGSFNVHIYKELPRWANMPEVVGTFMAKGKRHWPKEQPYADYYSEQAAFKKLLAKYNPKTRLWITETAINTGVADPQAKSGIYSGAYFVSELSQAKYLARLYVVNQMFGIGPTFWWTLDPFILKAHWGLIDQYGKRKSAWYALRNYSAIFDASLKLQKRKNFILISGTAPNIFGAVFEADDHSLIVPMWCAVPMNNANRGDLISIAFRGFDAVDIEAYDLISGTRQRLNFKNNDGYTIVKDFIIRDYPIVLKLIPKNQSLAARN